MFCFRPVSGIKPSTSAPNPRPASAASRPPTADPLAAESRSVTVDLRPVSAVERPETAGEERPETAGDNSEDKTSTDNSEIAHQAVDLLKSRVCSVLFSITSWHQGSTCLASGSCTDC